MTTEVETRETNIDQARQEVDRLLQAEKDIVGKFLETRQQLPAAQEQAGDAILSSLLDGKAAPKSGSQLATLEAEISSLKAAEVACQRRRIEAINNVWSMEAKAQRDKAARLLEEADEREPKTQELLRQLEEWEGCQYAPVRPERSRSTMGMVGGSPNLVVIPTPKTALLRNEATGLEKEAGTWESKRLNRNGAIEEHTAVHTLEEVLEYIHSDPYRVGCSAIEAVDWFEKAAAGEEERRAKALQRSGDLPPVRITFSYKDGVIDERQSRVYTPPLN